MKLRRAAVPAIVSIALILGFSGQVARGASRAEERAAEAEVQAHNAARADNGARVSLELIGPQATQNTTTMPENSADGNTRTRCVVSGPPFVFRFDLVATLPITHMNFLCSSYNTEETPKDIDIRLSDGTVIRHTLDAARPESRSGRVRQRVDIGGKWLDWVEVKVLSNYEGGMTDKGTRINWGGIGEIEIITTADLKPYLTVADYNPDAPVYSTGESPRADYSGVKVTMPSVIPMGRYPGVYLSREEIVALREKMKSDPRATPMLAKLFADCDEWAKKEIIHPDPKVPAQMRDRSDPQARAHSLLAKMAGWFGWAYQLSDKDVYAEKAREILVGYAKLYPNGYKEHRGVHPSDTSKVFAQRLSEAMWILPLIQSYDLIHDAKCMSDPDRKLIEEDLIRTAIRFINSKKSAADEVAARDKADANWRTTAPTGPRKTVGNWTNFYNAAYIQGGICLRDQNWVDIGMANARSNLHYGIGDDGMWGEGAIGYHLFGRHALVAGLEALARKGIDLYSFEDCRFKNLFDAPIRYAYPDGTAPGINDSGRAFVGGSWEAMAFDFAYLRYGDPNYGAIINGTARQIFQSEGCYFPTVIYEKLHEQPIAGLGSLVFDKLGYAIMRGTDGGSQTYFLMDYGPHGGGHGHPDKLNLILFADGDELAGEPQGYRYEDRRHAEWSRPTIAHWALAVDKAKQAATTGKLLVFHDAGGVKVVRGVCDTAYAGVALDRTVVQMPGYLVDIYRAWGPTEHVYDYPLCFRGALDALDGVDPATLKPMGSPSERGYKHILASAPVVIQGSWTGTWSRPAVTVAEGQEFDETVPNDDRRTHPANVVKATVVHGHGSVLYTGTVPGGRHQAIIRREGKEAVFATVVDPYKATDVVKSADRIVVDGPVPGYGLRVVRTDGGTDIIIVRYDMQKDGKPARMSMFEGGNISGISPAVVRASGGALVEVGRGPQGALASAGTNALVTVLRLDETGRIYHMGLIGGTGVFFSVGEKVQHVSIEKPGILWEPREDIGKFDVMMPTPH